MLRHRPILRRTDHQIGALGASGKYGVDVAFAIADDNETVGFGATGSGTPSTLQPAHRFLVIKLALATLDPGVYRCAVSVAGISDMPRFLHWVDRQKGYEDSEAQRFWDRFMGVTDRHDPALDALSPITHIGAVTVPILLIHGKDDTVVPYEQSDIMAVALKAAGKPTELVTLEDEDHWLSRSATRQQMLQATVAFLKKHNPPD